MLYGNVDPRAGGSRGIIVADSKSSGSDIIAIDTMGLPQRKTYIEILAVAYHAKNRTLVPLSALMRSDRKIRRAPSFMAAFPSVASLRSLRLH